MQIKKATIGDDGWPVIDGEKYRIMGGESLYLDGNPVGHFYTTKEKNRVLVLNGWPGFVDFAKAMGRSEVQICFGGETIIEVPLKDFEEHYLSNLEAIHSDCTYYQAKEIDFPFGRRVPDQLVEELLSPRNLRRVK